MVAQRGGIAFYGFRFNDFFIEFGDVIGQAIDGRHHGRALFVQGLHLSIDIAAQTVKTLAHIARFSDDLLA